MRITNMWLPVLGLSICLTGALPAAAQGGRGAGRSAGSGMGQASRPETRSSAQGMTRSTERAQSATVSQALEKNSQLSSRLQALLPTGTNLADAAAGFKNTGQFIAAVHVSNNLGIPFDGLKTELLAGDSLGKSIQTLKPNLSKSEVTAEVKKAKDAAKVDMKATTQQRESKASGDAASPLTRHTS